MESHALLFLRTNLRFNWQVAATWPVDCYDVHDSHSIFTLVILFAIYGHPAMLVPNGVLTTSEQVMNILFIHKWPRCNG